MRNLNVVILIIFFAASCSKEDDNPTQFDDSGIVINMPYQWKRMLHASGIAQSNSYIKKPIIYDSFIGIPTTDENNGKLFSAMNYNTGLIEWSWNDIFPSSSDYIDIRDYYLHDNLFFWQTGARSYCIDLEDGSTRWKVQRNRSFHSRINGYEDEFYIKGFVWSSSGCWIQVGYKGSIETGEIEQFLVPGFSFEHVYGERCADVTEMLPYVIDGVLHLIVVYQEVMSSESVSFQSFLGLYNMETEEWVYDRKPMNEPCMYGVSLAPPAIHDGKIYANISKELVCHNIYTGEQIWSRRFQQDFSFSGFIIEDGMLIANCEDLRIYRLNPETGGVIWVTEGAGTSSKMSYLNGVVYFVGGSTGRLHAVDAYTGQILWRLDAGLIEGSGSVFFPDLVYAIQGQGDKPSRIIARTPRYAYSFEAYQ